MKPRLLLRARLRPALAALWHAMRQWSGDAAYETYLSRASSGPRLSPEAFYLDGLRRRYGGPGRCC